jgi:hypothetical protein
MNVLFLSVRALHVLCAAFWLGSVTLLAFFVMPSIDKLGADAGKVMTNLQRAGLNAFMGAIAGLTILSGIYLYWHLTSGFDPTISATTEAKVFGVGGLLGLVAAILGGSVVGRSARTLEATGATLATTTDGATRTQLLAEMERLRARVKSSGNIVIALLVVTVILMAIGHYV